MGNWTSYLSPMVQPVLGEYERNVCWKSFWRNGITFLDRKMELERCREIVLEFVNFTVPFLFGEQKGNADRPVPGTGAFSCGRFLRHTR